MSSTKEGTIFQQIFSELYEQEEYVRNEIFSM